MREREDAVLWRSVRLVTTDTWLLRQLVATLRARGYERGSVGRARMHYAISEVLGKTRVEWWEPEPDEDDRKAGRRCRGR